jgi:thymidylate synthase
MPKPTGLASAVRAAISFDKGGKGLSPPPLFGAKYSMSPTPGLSANTWIDVATLGEGWLHALDLVLRDGSWTTDDGEHLLEVLPLTMRIGSVDADDPIILKHADQERIGRMLTKHRSLDVLPGYKVSYGRLLYDNGGVDQVAWAAERLGEKLETKSATIGLHIAGEAEQSCLSLLDFKYRSDKLAMTAVYRSQNVWGSQPGNLLALREVQEQVATAVGVAPGHLDLVALSAHIYERDIERARSAREAASSLL